MCPESPLRTEELNRFIRFIFSLAEDKRDFLFEFLHSEAPDFIDRFAASLPDLGVLEDLDPRALQELLRSASFATLAWTLYNRSPELVELCAENMSQRARVLLKEEIDQVRRHRQREDEEQRLDPDKFQQIKDYKTLIFRMRLQKWKEKEKEETVE